MKKLKYALREHVGYNIISYVENCIYYTYMNV